MLDADTLAKHGAPWTPDDDEFLRQEWPHEKPRRVAEWLGRTFGSCACRANVLGVIAKKTKGERRNAELAKTGSKRCTICTREMLLDQFYQNGPHLGSWCKECTRKRARQSVEQVLRGAWLDGVKKKAGSTLTMEEVMERYHRQEGLCFYTGRILTYAEAGCPYSVSIDRIDSSKPYTKDNIVICGADINYMKGDSPSEFFIQQCREVAAANKT